VAAIAGGLPLRSDVRQEGGDSSPNCCGAEAVAVQTPCLEEVAWKLLRTALFGYACGLVAVG